MREKAAKLTFSPVRNRRIHLVLVDKTDVFIGFELRHHNDLISNGQVEEHADKTELMEHW